MATITASVVYNALAAIGLTRAQARKLLPSWWDPAVEKSPGGTAELAMLLARRLSVDVAALMRGQVVRRGAAHSVAYKHQAGLDVGALAAASCVASSLAQAVVAAMRTPYAGFEADASRLGTQLLKEHATIGFDALLALCWSSGVPVIPLPHLPVGMRKMDGAVLGLADRPAIILAKRKSSRAWLAFILAHEIGHISRDHVRSGSSIVDVALQDMATYATESSTDKQEREADEFALKLLGGANSEAAVQAWGQRLASVEIAVRARDDGRRLRVDPGHLILRYAFASKRWPDAMTALNFLSEDVDADKALVTALAQHIDPDLIADDLRDLVTQVTGMSASSN